MVSLKVSERLTALQLGSVYRRQVTNSVKRIKIHMGLPQEIIEDIFVRLPVKPLLRFKCVCRLWHAIIESSDFVHRHIKHSKESITNHHLIFTELDCDKPLVVYASSIEKGHDASLLGLNNSWTSMFFGSMCTSSCNGLLLLHGQTQFDDVALWNPFTRRYKKIPHERFDLTSPVPRSPPTVTYGFGYDALHDDYMVVRIMGFRPFTNVEQMADEVKVYSLKQNTWKRMQDFIHCKWVYYLQSGVFVSGATHWLVRHNPVPKFTIMAFNFGKEELQVLPFPQLTAKEFRNDNLLTNIQGYLCLITTCQPEHSTSTHQCTLYFMKEYGVSGSWNKTYIVGQSDIPHELGPVMPAICSNRWGEKVLLDSSIVKKMYRYNGKKYAAMELHNKTIACSLVLCSESLLMQNDEFGAVGCRN